MSHVDYAPKHVREIAAINDLHDDGPRPRVGPHPAIPAFLRRQDQTRLKQLADELSDTSKLGRAIDNGRIPSMSTQEDPRQLVGALTGDEDIPAEMVAEIKRLLKNLPYGVMKQTGAEIGKLAGIEGAKQADALHAWATEQKTEAAS